MKIDVTEIPAEGLTLEESVDVSELDLNTEMVSFKSPVNVRVKIARITNTVTADLVLSTLVKMICSRCLSEFTANFRKSVRLNYIVNKFEPTIDLDPVIAEEIILENPIRPLCKPECIGFVTNAALILMRENVIVFNVGKGLQLTT